MAKNLFTDYEGFVEKFKPKKTTDDCYTPAAVYGAVLDWVDKNLMPLKGKNIRRPFYPGGDYEREAEDYGPNDVVIDNPPFSILASIRSVYLRNNIPYFLFAPALSLFSAPRDGAAIECYICADATIIYANGAKVRTSFVTNMERSGTRVWVCGSLGRRLTEISAAQKATVSLPKYTLPESVITPATLGRISTRGIDFKIPAAECAFIRTLDSMKAKGKAFFGGGYLLSERAAAERAAAEARSAYVFELSPREREMQKLLSNDEQHNTSL